MKGAWKRRPVDRLAMAKFSRYWPSRSHCGEIAAAEDADLGGFEVSPARNSRAVSAALPMRPKTDSAGSVPAGAVGAEQRINGF